MGQLLSVGIGGFIGSIIRYLLFININKIYSINFPFGTLFINILGCLAIGYFSALFTDTKNSMVQEFIIIGILGGFTTFSAFGMETYELIKNNFLGAASLYVFASIICSIIAIHIGGKLHMTS